MKYVIEFGPIPTLPVAGGSDLFPVGRIYCVGLNYAEHAREMGHDPDREPPFFFMKWMEAVRFQPESAIIRIGGLRFAPSTLVVFSAAAKLNLNPH